MDTAARTDEPAPRPAARAQDAAPIDRQKASAALAGTVWAVWAVWAGMTLLALWLAFVYASSIPYWDEWNAIVPVLTRQQPVTLAWLWSPHNEHRILLPRLLILGLLRLSGGDFRIGAYVNTLLLALMAAVGIRTAAAVRGKPSWTDILFPILILHPRNYENLFWMFEIQVLLAVGLNFAVVCAGLRFGRTMRPWLLTACAAACLAIPLCGAFDLLSAPLLALWIIGVAFLRLRDPAEPAAGRPGLWTALLLSLLVPVLAAAYFLHLDSARHAIPEAGALLSALGMLLRFGTGGAPSLPAAGYLSLAVPLLLPVAFVLLTAVWPRRRTSDRARLLLLFAYLLGALAGSVSIAYGRPEAAQWTDLASRYGLLAAQNALGIYLAFVFLQRRSASDGVADSAPASAPPFRTISFGLAATMAAAVTLLGIASLSKGITAGEAFQAERCAMEGDVAAQMPLPALVAKYGTFLFISREYVAEHIVGLTREGVGAFRGYRTADLASRAVPLSLDPGGPVMVSGGDEARSVTRQQGQITLANPSTGGSARLLLELPGGMQPVVGLRLWKSVTFGGPPGSAATPDARLSIQWDHAAPEAGPSSVEIEPLWDKDGWHPDDRPLTVYVGEPVDHLLLRPVGNYRSLTIRRIELLVPSDAAAASP